MRVLVTGASGQLGVYLLDALEPLRCAVIAASGAQRGERRGHALVPLALDDPERLGKLLDALAPDAVLHAGAISKPAGVLEAPELARRVNVEATGAIARWCASNARRLVFTSTDLVFDGRRGWYREGDAVSPTGLYARMKVDAEARVLACAGGLVARLALLYGPSRQRAPSYFDDAIEALRAGEPQTFFVDEWRTPLDLDTAALALVGLLGGTATGVVHVGGPSRLTRMELMRGVAEGLGIDVGLVRGNRLADRPGPEPRPADTSLETRRLMELLPNLERPSPREAAARWN
jgi:dTDP-4-dehydrorhamnose reductase